MYYFPRMNARFGRNPSTEMAWMNTEAMLFDPEKNKFFQLNPTAAFVWEQLAEPSTAARLASEVSHRFEGAPPPDAIHEVQALLEQMLTHQLVVLVE